MFWMNLRSDVYVFKFQRAENFLLVNFARYWYPNTNRPTENSSVRRSSCLSSVLTSIIKQIRKL